MVYLYRGFLYCILYLTSQIAVAGVSAFPNSNTVPTDSGQTAKLIGVTAINSSARTASVVIDAKDRFGNKMRLFKTASISPSKIKTYVKTCLTNPLACAASAALTAALVYYGYTITPDGFIVLPGSAGTYPQCAEKPVPIDGSGATYALGPIPCVLGPNWAEKYSLYTLSPMDPAPELIQSQPLNGFYYLGESEGHYGTFYNNVYSAEPIPTAESQTISDEQLADIALEDPQLIQIEPGVYPDIFRPLEITETLPEEAISTEPESDDQSDRDPAEEYEDMVDMDSIPERTVDISSYFTWGSGWLPKECPAPKILNFKDRQFSFDLAFTCEAIRNYLAPAIRAFAIFTFLAIVIGGARD